MPGNFYSKKLEWTSNANRLKFNGWFSQIDMNLIGPAIVAFVRSQLDNIRETKNKVIAFINS